MPALRHSFEGRRLAVADLQARGRSRRRACGSRNGCRVYALGDGEVLPVAGAVSPPRAPRRCHSRAPGGQRRQRHAGAADPNRMASRRIDQLPDRRRRSRSAGPARWSAWTGSGKTRTLSRPAVPRPSASAAWSAPAGGVAAVGLGVTLVEGQHEVMLPGRGGSALGEAAARSGRGALRVGGRAVGSRRPPASRTSGGTASQGRAGSRFRPGRRQEHRLGSRPPPWPRHRRDRRGWGSARTGRASGPVSQARAAGTVACTAKNRPSRLTRAPAGSRCAGSSQAAGLGADGDRGRS